MSRKAETNIIIPKGVEINVVGNIVTIKGPKGSLTQEVKEGIVVSVKDNAIQVSLDSNKDLGYNFLGLYWSLINNMVKGVSEGFVKQLQMIGVGFRAAVQSDLLDLQVGFSHPTKLPIPEGLQVSVEKSTLISVLGVDKQQVGQFAAIIRSKRPPEPYKGKGIRYLNEYVRKKAGKAGKK